MWNLPGPGIEPMSPALAGRLLTARLPGKSWTPGLMVVHLPIEEELTKLWGWDGEQRWPRCGWEMMRPFGCTPLMDLRGCSWMCSFGVQSRGLVGGYKSEVLQVFRWISQVALVIKNPTCQCRRLKRCGFYPWVGKIPWSRKRQPAPVLLPEKSHGWRSLAGCSP